MVRTHFSLCGWASRAGVFFLLLGAACGDGGRPLRAAQPGSEPAEAPEPPVDIGCPASVQALPPSLHISAGDPRLSGDDLIVVLKGQRRMGLYSGGKLVNTPTGAACWPVALGVTMLGSYPEGPKQRQGDRKTPEGWYRTSDKPSSQFYAAIAVHYPNADDAERGLRQGLITQGQRDAIVASLARGQKPNQNTALGGEILIHGGGSFTDWTLGCVAMDDAEIDALRAQLPKGMSTDLLILP